MVGEPLRLGEQVSGVEECNLDPGHSGVRNVSDGCIAKAGGDTDPSGEAFVRPTDDCVSIVDGAARFGWQSLE